MPVKYMFSLFWRVDILWEQWRKSFLLIIASEGTENQIVK